MSHGYDLIDPPVGPFSPAEEIQAWLETLARMQPSDEVGEAIRAAREWLVQARDAPDSQ